MKEIHSELMINAPRKIIWEILTDFSAYGEWNPFIVKVIGTAKPGRNVLFVARMNGLFIPVLAKIMAYEELKKFSWGGPGIRLARNIFGAEHFFSLEEISPGQCRFLNYEQMEGVVANVIWPLIENSRPAYVAMNEALKARAEARR